MWSIRATRDPLFYSYLAQTLAKATLKRASDKIVLFSADFLQTNADTFVAFMP